MMRSVVCDAGGLLVAAGALSGAFPDASEVLALDWTSITVGRYVATRHDGNPVRVEAELGMILAAVHEWFPVRSLVPATLRRAGLDAVDALDSWSALLLAEQLDLPLFTASDEVSSTVIEIVRP